MSIEGEKMDSDQLVKDLEALLNRHLSSGGTSAQEVKERIAVAEGADQHERLN